MEYTTIKIPKALAKQIDKVVGFRGYKSRSQFAQEAIKQLLKEVKKS